MIYKKENSGRLVSWVNEFDKNNCDYYSDYKDCIEIINNKVIQNQMLDIIEANKRSKFEEHVDMNDLVRR
jgi:hypothetical protein